MTTRPELPYDFRVDDLLKLFRQRRKDRIQSKTKRRKSMEASPQPMGDLLGNYFAGNPEALRKIEETRALLAWETYVGSAAARVTQALRLRGNMLVVRVPDPLWMQQLSFLKQELLKKYAKDFPKLKIREIFFTRTGN